MVPYRWDHLLVDLVAKDYFPKIFSTILGHTATNIMLVALVSTTSWTTVWRKVLCPATELPTGTLCYSVSMPAMAVGLACRDFVHLPNRVLVQ